MTHSEGVEWTWYVTTSWVFVHQTMFYVCIQLQYKIQAPFVQIQVIIQYRLNHYTCRLTIANSLLATQLCTISLNIARTDTNKWVCVSNFYNLVYTLCFICLYYGGRHSAYKIRFESVTGISQSEYGAIWITYLAQ